MDGGVDDEEEDQISKCHGEVISSVDRRESQNIAKIKRVRRS